MRKWSQATHRPNTNLSRPAYTHAYVHSASPLDTVLNNLRLPGLALLHSVGMAASTSQRRRPNLHTLLGIARRVQQQSTAGDDIEVTASERAVAERVAIDLRETLLARSWVPAEDMKLLWREPGQDTAAFLALFGLAIRRSNPLATGDSPATSYTSIRRNLSEQLLHS